MPTSRLTVAFAIALLAISALAGPAPWYTWRSKLDGKTVCTPTSPGEGWVQDSGPTKMRAARGREPVTDTVPDVVSARQLAMRR